MAGKYMGEFTRRVIFLDYHDIVGRRLGHIGLMRKLDRLVETLIGLSAQALAGYLL